MSDVSQGPGWWIASDGRWYAPELHPSARGAAGRAAAGATGTAGGGADFGAFGGGGPSTDPTEARFLREPHQPAKRSFRLATFGARAIGYIVDYFAMGLVLWGVSILGFGFGRGGGAVSVILMLAFLYWYQVNRVATGGQTWGMRIVKVHVAEKSSGEYPVGHGRAFIRFLVAVGFLLVPFGAFVDLLWPLWDPYRQTLHDKAAGTVVMTASL